MRIDGQGRYLMPGLADMHVHVWNEEEYFMFVANGVTTVRVMAGDPRHFTSISATEKSRGSLQAGPYGIGVTGNVVNCPGFGPCSRVVAAIKALAVVASTVIVPSKSSSRSALGNN